MSENLSFYEKLIENCYKKLETETDHLKIVGLIETIATSATTMSANGHSHGRDIAKETRERLKASKNPILVDIWERISNSGVDTEKVNLLPNSEWSMYVLGHLTDVYRPDQKLRGEYYFFKPVYEQVNNLPFPGSEDYREMYEYSKRNGVPYIR